MSFKNAFITALTIPKREYYYRADFYFEYLPDMHILRSIGFLQKTVRGDVVIIIKKNNEAESSNTDILLNRYFSFTHRTLIQKSVYIFNLFLEHL